MSYSGLNWKPVSVRMAAAVTGVLLLLALLRQSNSTHWIFILDDANLVFHEAGHPLFGLLGSTLGLYGGTLGQLVFPIFTSLYFWREWEPTGFALCLAWLFENLLNISRYMADARVHRLPLVGGGEHDWTIIFTRWGVLRHTDGIAGFVGFLGWLGITGCGFWILYRSAKEEMM